MGDDNLDSKTDSLDKNTSKAPSSNDETRSLQRDPEDSAALRDPDIDESQIKTLPGTGGPDDVGEIEVDASEINPKGRPE